jgi:MFS family permease
MMTNSPERADAIDLRPSSSSMNALDAVNFFMAAALSCFGAYVALFLADQGWTLQNIGFVLTAGGLAGLVSQVPCGELLDTIRFKRAAIALGAVMIAAGAVIIAIRPSFPWVLVAFLLQGVTGGFLGPAVASISLGLVGQAELGERLGRNQRFASVGGVLAAGLMGLVSYYLSYRAIFLLAAALLLPLLAALTWIAPSEIDYGRACGATHQEGLGRPSRGRRRSLWTNRGLVVFAACLFLFQMANASMLPLAAAALAHAESGALIVSALIVVPQLIVAGMAPWAGRQAKSWGRRPVLLAGFAALPIRAMVFAWTTDPWILIAAQLLDGVSGTALGVLTALTVADVTRGSGRFNLGQGVVGTLSGFGAALSTTLSGQVAGSLGHGAGFTGIAGVALAAFLLLWLAMPETSPRSA